MNLHKGYKIQLVKSDCPDYFTVHIKKPCGEFVWGFEFVPSYNRGMEKAVYFIDNFT